ncbi:Alpha/Beta hydrolase protein [Emericellopsis atlantica]|uniref:Carboxypeptidase n=1 Tax=Emericellopsis atlantica TaxID=2614577 RepID=A0A9P7ZJF5_9HYPO|nr:Alpha/Beta hydrolase protein [Emericellopsis atlantica]KAG9252725.1 Alpha/Beta hydrolase protein [Emericellopsis atlantica]
MHVSTTLAWSALTTLVAAQFPPPLKGLKTLQSKFHENVTITYKEPNICETNDGVKSYAGHVHLPPGFLNDIDGEPQDYPLNTFFYFFEARIAPEDAPLAIWLNGGPGGSSMLGLFTENGPCSITLDSNDTEDNPWSWNTFVNMLYIDEPNQVGLSYDTPTNVTMELLEGMEFDVKPLNVSDGQVPESNYTHRVGTMSSQKQSHTTNSTAQAAHALWHFAQTWFEEFPHYKPHDDRISLWAESYGGHYGPGFMRFFQEQNEKIKNGTLENGHYMHLDTLGIVNGLLDAVVQGEAYIEFPYNNTYDIQVFSDDLYSELLHNWTKPDGCKDQLLACQDRLRSYDPITVHRGLVPVAEICDTATQCSEEAIMQYNQLGHSWFDIAHPAADPFPDPMIHGYLSQAHVLEALGTPVNFSWIGLPVSQTFAASHDEIHGGFLDAVGYLLDSGVKVHMMYGDRDYACNWLGGEAASLAVPYSRQAEFNAAPYGLFWTPDGFSGITRQYGNFSFTRVFQAGHMVPSYQPVAAYEVFMRAMFNKDIGSGTIPVRDDLINDGEGFHRWIKNERPDWPEERCYVLQPSSCQPETWERVIKGKAKVVDYFVVEDEDELDEL